MIEFRAMANNLKIPEGDLNLLREFQRYKIPFVIIGGHAVRFHGVVDRGVDDLDVAVDSVGRSEDLAAAILKVSGISLLDNSYLEKPYKQMSLKNVRLYCDLLTSIKA